MLVVHVFALQCQADDNVDNWLFYKICDIVSHEVSLDKDQIDCRGDRYYRNIVPHTDLKVSLFIA